MKTIKKILIGKLFRFHKYGELFVIVGVKMAKYYPYHLQVLIARYDKRWRGCEIYSWYGFNQKSVGFEGRDSKENIKKCLKTNPDKIKFHVGRTVNLNEILITDNSYAHYYDEYLKETEGIN